MQQQLKKLFDEYNQSHQNNANRYIHNIAVPIIYISILGLFWDLPWPKALSFTEWFNSSAIAITVMLLFYAFRSITLTIGILALSAIGIYGSLILQEQGQLVWLWSLVIFIIAWIAQFIGHAIEGKKPSFFKDLQFLLIGPGWVLAKLYKKLNIPL